MLSISFVLNADIGRYADALISYTRFAAVAQARVTVGNRAFCTVYIYTSVCVASAGQASLKKNIDDLLSMQLSFSVLFRETRENEARDFLQNDRNFFAPSRSHRPRYL